MTVLVIGGMIGASLLTNFSVAQNYGPSDSDLLDKLIHFLMPNNTLYLTASTEPNTYTIHFDGNWWIWIMDSLPMTYDQEKNLLANNFVKDWSAFKWWSSTQAWEVEYADKESVKNLTAQDGWQVTLYAQRESKVPYIIEYYQENLDWTWYDFVETGTEYAMVWPQTILTWKTYEWFTLQTWAEVIITSGAVIPYRYTRNTYHLIAKDRNNTLIDTWMKYKADIILPSDLTWTWNTFSWWTNMPVDKKMPAKDLEIISDWSYGRHTITFNTDWWTPIAPISGNYWDPVNLAANPTKEWYKFLGWDPILPQTIPADDITVTAVWEQVRKPSGGWSWRWSRWWVSPEPSGWEEHGAPTIPTPQTGANDGTDLEVLFAHMWAYDMWITDMEWKDSDPDGYIPRWDMAKMIVRFTENVLSWQIPPIPAHCAWWDDPSEWKSLATKIYAEKACALGVMWIRMQNFMPNKLVDRAEFWTILSRLLWWDKYDVVDATKTKLYYTRHLEALSKNKIMTQIEDPEGRHELRKWAWLMLMRVKLQ